jgi:hypothetical protein
MAHPASIHEELSSLRSELRQSTKPQASRREDRVSPAPGRTEADAVAASGLEEQIRELGAALSDFTDGAEDVITEHPIATVLAAFVLGIAVGRLMGRA